MADAKFIRKAILELSAGGSVPSTSITGTTYADITWGQGSTPIAEATLMAKANQLETDADLNELRKTRDRLLTASDWTQGAYSPLSDSDKAAWATYRQALRDVTNNATSLDDVTWPTKP